MSSREQWHSWPVLSAAIQCALSVYKFACLFLPKDNRYQAVLPFQCLPFIFRKLKRLSLALTLTNDVYGTRPWIYIHETMNIQCYRLLELNSLYLAIISYSLTNLSLYPTSPYPSKPLESSVLYFISMRLMFFPASAYWMRTYHV